jgi:membrane associated rhomboid family serine protease
MLAGKSLPSQATGIPRLSGAGGSAYTVAMGFQDRDYYREPRGSGRGAVFGGMSMWSVTTWLIVINIAVFILDRVLERMGVLGLIPIGIEGHQIYARRALLLESLGNFSTYSAIFHLQVWRFLTFQFLHANITHIFFNMLALYFFGPLVESFLGSRRYLAFYLITGACGALGYLFLGAMHVLISNPFVPLIGASAGIFGVLVAAALIAPDTTVMLLFPPIPLKLKTLAWIFIGIAVFSIFTAEANAGGEAAHLGGAVGGYLLIRYPQALAIFARKRKKSTWEPWRQ